MQCLHGNAKEKFVVTCIDNGQVTMARFQSTLPLISIRMKSAHCADEHLEQMQSLNLFT